MKSVKIFLVGLLVGASLMVTTSSLASSIKEYILVQAQYPVYVNDQLYESDELPILNYQGHTYVPLRATSELLGVNITWNEALRQVEISHDRQGIQNQAFRKIEVSGTKGHYTITGEARVFEATIQYEVEDGHVIYVKGFETASSGAPEWGTFTIEIDIFGVK